MLLRTIELAKESVNNFTGLKHMKSRTNDCGLGIKIR